MWEPDPGADRSAGLGANYGRVHCTEPAVPPLGEDDSPILTPELELVCSRLPPWRQHLLFSEDPMWTGLISAPRAHRAAQIAMFCGLDL